MRRGAAGARRPARRLGYPSAMHDRIYNVNVVSEITNLITAQRAYEMNSKVIQTADAMSATLTQLR